MEVDKSGAESQLRIAKKKSDAELEEQRLQLEMSRASRERDRAILAEREKGERQMVEISAAATAQMDGLKKTNTERVRALGENTQKHFQELAEKTAEEIRQADRSAFDMVEAKKLSSMERVRNVTDRSQDPFYQMKSLAPVMSESDKAFVVKVSLPEHEAKNLFVSGEGQYLKLSLSRRFQEDAKNPESHNTTRTNSFQSISEQIAIPGAFDGKKVSREYRDGVVTITVPKIDFTPKDIKRA